MAVVVLCQVLMAALMKHLAELDVPAAGRLKIHTHADRDPYISGSLMNGHIFEPHILSVLTAFLQTGSRFLDVGANIGWFAMIGSRLVGKSGRVYAVEPDPDNHRLLRQNLAANDCRNVREWRCAAGPGSRTAVLSRSSTNRGDHRMSVQPVTDDIRSVKVRSIDRLLWPARRIDTVLIDTQGSEVNVFRGMRAVLRRNKMLRVIFEFWPLGLESCGCSVDDLAAIVREQGWLMWMIEQDMSVMPVVADDLIMLARDRFSPASEKHADIVAVSPNDAEAIGFMRSQQISQPQAAAL